MSKKKNNPFHEPQLVKRHRSAKIFKFLSMGALALSISFLVLFLSDMIFKGMSAFQEAKVKVEVSFNKKSQKISSRAVERKYRRIVSRSWTRTVPMMIKENPKLMNTKQFIWVLADDSVDQYLKGRYSKIKSKYKKIVDEMVKNGNAKLVFNTTFFTNGDSKLPEFAGILSAMIGTMFVLFVTMAFAFPIGVMTAVYLEEFSIENGWTKFLEININNLAAIPSILFGLLGLAIFINLFGMPRSSALVGGLTLGLMTLPVIIVSSRAALRSVPDSIRQAGYGLGLTKLQVVRDHVLPIAFPGIMTGSIIGLAQAIGETAPLIIVGMIAFIPDAPSSIMEASTVLPAQIFTWAGMPEGAYIEKTAAGILVLLSILISMNAVAIYLRNKFQKKW
jgi:phosphate transport system permease protein